MKQFEVTVNVTEYATIDYTILIDANDANEAKIAVNRAIKRDGTAFNEFLSSNELIIDTYPIDGEEEVIDSVVESLKKEDDCENNF